MELVMHGVRSAAFHLGILLYLALAPGLICLSETTAQTEIPDCDQNAQIQMDSSYKLVCVCKDGYTGNGTVCQAHNKCLKKEDNNCHPDAICKNNSPEYECKCKEGFSGDGYTCTEGNTTDTTSTDSTVSWTTTLMEETTFTAEDESTENTDMVAISTEPQTSTYTTEPNYSTDTIADNTTKSIVDNTTENRLKATTGSLVKSTMGDIVKTTTGSIVQTTMGDIVKITTGSIVKTTTISVVKYTTGSIVNSTTGSIVNSTTGSIAKSTSSREDKTTPKDQIVIECDYGWRGTNCEVFDIKNPDVAVVIGVSAVIAFAVCVLLPIVIFIRRSKMKGNRNMLNFYGQRKRNSLSQTDRRTVTYNDIDLEEAPRLGD